MQSMHLANFTPERNLLRARYPARQWFRALASRRQALSRLGWLAHLDLLALDLSRGSDRRAACRDLSTGPSGQGRNVVLAARFLA